MIEIGTLMVQEIFEKWVMQILVIEKLPKLIKYVMKMVMY